MKVLVISDTHSNIDALRAVEKEVGNFDRVLFLGDMVDYGFFPHEVVHWMQEHDVRAVAGNHDRHLVSMADQGIETPANPFDAPTFAIHNLTMLTREDIEYLRCLPDERVEEIDGITYYMAHTHSKDDQQAFLKKMINYQSVEAFEQVWTEKVGTATRGQPRRIIYGHSHQCMAHIVRRDAMWLNPGSMSYRVGPDSIGSGGGDYILIQDGEVLLRHVDYPTEHLYQMVEMSALQSSEKANGRNFYKESF